MCEACFTTIDLTSLQKTSAASIRRNSPKAAETYGLPQLDITCPHCGAGTTCDYNDVKPLENWKDAQKALDRRIETLEKRFDDPHFHSDIAKAVLNQIAEQEPKAKTDNENPLAR